MTAQRLGSTIHMTEQLHPSDGAAASGNGHESQSAIGSRVPALNSRALVAGRGIYVGDIPLPGMLEIARVRGMSAHPLIKSINTRSAQALAGVVCEVAGDEIRR